jgi:hypothetical protein
MKTNTLFFLIAISLIFTSCYTLNVAEIRSKENKIPIETLDLRMGFEVYDLRIDLLRETTTQTVTGANGTVSSQTVNVPYHYLGVYLFDGVFLDLNNNLCFNVIDLIDKTYKKNFEVGLKNKLKQNTKFFYTVKRQGNEVNCVYRNFLGNSKTSIQFLDSGIVINGAGLQAKENIRVEKDRLVYGTSGLFKRLSKAEIVRTKKGYKVPRFGRDLEYFQTDKKTIVLDKNGMIKNNGDKVEFIYKGILGTNNKYTLLKLKDGYIFHDKRNRGVRIKVDDNKIFVEKNGTLIKYYEVLN